MKTRIGFISNSSSTSFYFFTKEDGVLTDLIRKRDEFCLGYFGSESDIEDINDWICTPNRIADAILNLNKAPEDIKLIRKLIVDNLNFWKKDNWSMSKDYIDMYKDLLKKIDDAISKGFTKLYIIGFGDNHGDISGQGIGTTMDYNGRDIYINSDDLIVFTEQNR